MWPAEASRANTPHLSQHKTSDRTRNRDDEAASTQLTGHKRS